MRPAQHYSLTLDPGGCLCHCQTGSKKKKKRFCSFIASGKTQPCSRALAQELSQAVPGSFYAFMDSAEPTFLISQGSVMEMWPWVFPFSSEIWTVYVFKVVIFCLENNACLIEAPLWANRTWMLFDSGGKLKTQRKPVQTRSTFTQHRKLWGKSPHHDGPADHLTAYKIC